MFYHTNVIVGYGRRTTSYLAMWTTSNSNVGRCSNFSCLSCDFNKYKSYNVVASLDAGEVPLVCRQWLRVKDLLVHVTDSLGSSSMSSSSSEQPKESPANNPGLHASPDDSTRGYFMQQTMFRVKDPKVTLDFYSRVLGMSLLKRLDFPVMKFSLYFLGYENPASGPTDPTQRAVWPFSQKATLELTHNWGTENDPEFKGYHNGNSEPRGFGHIGITVDDTYKACERFEQLGVEFVKKPDDGKMKGIAFIKDPDGYWIEIFDLNRIGGVTVAAS